MGASEGFKLDLSRSKVVVTVSLNAFFNFGRVVFNDISIVILDLQEQSFALEDAPSRHFPQEPSTFLMAVQCLASEVLVPLLSQFTAIVAVIVDFLCRIGQHRLVIEFDVVGVVAARVVYVIVFFCAEAGACRPNL